MNGLTKTTAESRGKILEALEGPGPFLIASHKGPDGDALGSSLALKLWLEGRGKRVEVVNSDGVPDPFGFLPSADRVLLETPPDLLGCAAFASSAKRFSRMSTMSGGGTRYPVVSWATTGDTVSRAAVAPTTTRRNCGFGS